MIRSRAFTLVLIILLPLMIGCASGGMRKPTVFVDKPNSIPADISSQFLNRYEQFITGKEQKEFNKLLTDEERQIFIDKFWLERDPDPSTLENERKDEIDDRINDIAGERFFGMPGTTGLLFRSNGGFRGDMAHIYLLHGEPDAMDTIEGNSFVPLMLWIYLDSENGNILYAFLFYQKGNSGSFRLFYQDLYQMDQCGALYEIATLRNYNYSFIRNGTQGCPDDLYEVYNNIFSESGKGGILDGNIFIWALFNFSSDLGLKLGEAIQPPKSASENAKQSKARVTGEAPKLSGTGGTDYILASCENCNSMIPAELSLGERFTISGPWKNFDWAIKGEYAELSLKYRIVLQDHNAGKPIVLEGTTVTRAKKSSLDAYPELIIVVDLSGYLGPEQVAAIPPGKYLVSVYIKNITTGLMTKKYNAWSKQIIK